MSTFRRSTRRLKAGSLRRSRQRVESRRLGGCEPLEGRLLMAADVAPLHNIYNPFDVNDDGAVAPGDVLAVFNHLNRASGAGEAGEASQNLYLDVNADGAVSPMDALQTINALNAEGEDSPTVTYIVRTFNEAGTAEISSIGVGQKFQLRVSVRDNRVLGNSPNGNPKEGVFAAYLDVKYAAALANVSGTLTHNTTDYGQAPNGNTATDGVIDGAGSFRGSLTPLGRAEFLLWTLPMTSEAEGAITFAGEPTTSPNDPGDQGQSPSLDTSVYGDDRPVAPSSSAQAFGSMSFVNATLNVVRDITAGNDTFTVAEDANATTLTVLANDSVLNPPGATPTITAVGAGSAGGTITNNTSSVSYKPAANFAGTETFTYTISNGQTATATATVTVTVTAANDAPVATVPGAQTTGEDVNLVFNAANARKISFADPDGDVAVQVTLTAANGTLSVAAANGVTVTNNNSASVQLAGKISDINTLLDGSGATFIPTANFSGSGSVVAAINDQGNTGGAALSDSKTVTITITAVNDAPVNAVPGNSGTDENVELTFSTANGNALSVSDVDAGSSPLTVRLSLDQGGKLTLASTAGVTVTNNGTTAVDIVGSAAAITTALGAGVTYAPTADFNGIATLTMRSDDQGATGSGGSQVDTDTVAIDVKPPVLPKARNDAASVAEDTAAGITINVLQNDRANDNAKATLLSFTQPAAGGTVTLVDNGTPADKTDDQLKFVPNADFAGVATFTYIMNDTVPSGDPKNSTGTVNVTVTAVNDAPVNTVPGAQSATEDVALVINGLSVADVDVGTGNVEVTLTVTNGKLQVTAGGATVANNGTSSVKLTGTIAAVNGALAAGVTYTGNLNYNGADSLSMVTNDLGNTGSPGPLSDTDAVAINVAAVNDAPVNTVPTAQTAFKDQDFFFSLLNNNAIQIADADAGNASVQVTISNPNGNLSVANANGVTVAGNASGNLSLTGSVNAINAALSAGVTYRPGATFTGNTVITVVTNDQGNTGGAAQSDTDTIAVKVEEFLPSTVGGHVYVDSNGDGFRGVNEVGLSNVEVTLRGTDVFGAVVNVAMLTNSSGAFSFTGLKPGNYTLEETQPAAMRDGADDFGAGLMPVGNDLATITIVAPGGVNSDTTTFGEMGLEAQFVRASDLLASSARPDQNAGVIFGSDGLAAWAVLRGDGWENYENARFTILNRSADLRYATVTLTVFNKVTKTDRSVTLNSAVDSRLIFMQHGVDMVIEFRGRPQDLFAMGAGEGESSQTAAEYADAVDSVMAEAMA